MCVTSRFALHTHTVVHSYTRGRRRHTVMPIHSVPKGDDDDMKKEIMSMHGLNPNALIAPFHVRQEMKRRITEDANRQGGGAVDDNIGEQLDAGGEGDTVIEATGTETLANDEHHIVVEEEKAVLSVGLCDADAANADSISLPSTRMAMALPPPPSLGIFRVQLKRLRDDKHLTVGAAGVDELND